MFPSPAKVNCGNPALHVWQHSINDYATSHSALLALDSPISYLPTVLDWPGQSRRSRCRNCPAQKGVIFGYVPVLKKIGVFYLFHMYVHKHLGVTKSFTTPYGIQARIHIAETVQIIHSNSRIFDEFCVMLHAYCRGAYAKYISCCNRPEDSSIFHSLACNVISISLDSIATFCA